MEFNVLPRARVLSPQSRMKAHQTTSQTINVILPQQPKPTNTDETIPPITPIQNEIREPETNPYQNLDSGTVHYETREVNLNDSADKLNKEDSVATINFLKLVLNAYMNNPIKYNGYVICSVPALENLIETLTSCDDCDVEIPDIEGGCCGTKTTHIVPISKIWVKNNGSQEIFKYKYSQFLQTFEEYNISLKFVYVE